MVVLLQVLQVCPRDCKGPTMCPCDSDPVHRGAGEQTSSVWEPTQSDPPNRTRCNSTVLVTSSSASITKLY